ncbi:MAG: cobalamin biosynthesis protein [Candidatus Melainabacteria bacterium]|nr:cobalamin biosynthesis protein [Candidatus Melainabacteria bacterium]
MTIAIWVVRKEAESMAQELAESLGARLFCPWLVQASPRWLFSQCYSSFQSWIFVGTTGIAVRYLDGLLHDKSTDPCVVVLDEGGAFAVSLIGGHEGGGNELAYLVSSKLGAVPVVTTASESLKPLVLGVGCRRGVSASAVSAAVAHALPGRSLSDVREIATIDMKASEPGLLAFSRAHDIPLRIFRQEDLQPRQWCTIPSSHVLNTVGLDGVCEPCALMASPRGKLIVPKVSLNGVAVAAVEDARRIIT